MPDLMRQAFRVATSGAPGPVHLRIQSHLGQITEQEADLDALVEPLYRRMPPLSARARDAAFARRSQALAAAERPVIVAGGGVDDLAGAARARRSSPRSSQIPVATSLNAKAAWSIRIRCRRRARARTRAIARTARWPRPTSCSSSAATPADRSRTTGCSRRPARR